jgi:GT2 family glycosyltransferase
MSFRRKVIFESGMFDDRFRFGAEEVDLCMRMARMQAGRLVFLPEARVVHHFEPSLRDTFRRSKAYGKGSARLRRKWPHLPPTVFPAPPLTLFLLLLSPLVPALAAIAVAAPLLYYPRGPRRAVSTRRPAPFLDPYVQLVQETCEDVGFLYGLWQFRGLTPADTATAPLAAP